MKPWQRIEPTEVTKVGWRSIVRKRFVTGQGLTIDTDIVNVEGWQAAGVIALTVDGQVVVARQFRAGPERVMDEIPGGIVETSEDPEEAVRRELEEEVGYSVGEMKYLGKVYKDAWNNGTWHYYLATNCVPIRKKQHLDEHEEVEVGLISIDQLLRNAKNANMTDCEAVLLAHDSLKELQNG